MEYAIFVFLIYNNINKFLRGFSMKKEALVAAVITGLFSSLAVGGPNMDLKKVEIKNNGMISAPKQVQGQIKSGQDLKVDDSQAYNAIGCGNKKCGEKSNINNTNMQNRAKF